MKLLRSLVCLCLAFGLAASASGLTRRFAVIAGANDGGADRVQLRYANSDANAMAQVLTDLGGVAEVDLRLLLNVDRAGLHGALAEMQADLEAAKAAGNRVELLLYYSGHSDETGLLLGGERIDFVELRQVLDSLPADVRIAIVDSCASGTLTREKGGTRRPPFLIDTSSAVEGLAILTSSSADEASQESDRIGASFFTHYLVSALRGAADVDLDGRITLGEAYQFTFQETLASTERTQGGAQHPSYEMKLAGSGDLVMTDLRATSAGLLLSEPLEGVFFVRDSDGRLAAELKKVAGRPVQLGLRAGAYDVTLERAGVLAAASVTLTEGQPTTLGADDFEVIKGEVTVARGDMREVLVVDDYVYMPIEVALLPLLSSNGWFGPKPVNFLSLSVLGGNSAKLYGLGIGLGGNWVSEQLIGAQVSIGANIVGGEAIGLQSAVGGNYAHEPSQALQVAVGANISTSQLNVGQIAVGPNIAIDDLNGGQLGVALNLALGHTNGFQLAGGGANIANSLSGAQIGLINLGGDVTGAQLSLINLGGDVTGAQLGLINIGGRVTGAQLGLINAAWEMEGAPVGLLSLVGDGMHHAEVWSDDVNTMNLGLKLGSRYVYSFLSAGFQTFEEQPRWQFGLGLGGRVPLVSSLFIDSDVSAYTIYRNQWDAGDLDLHSRLRVSLGWRFFDHLAVIGGLSYNVMVTEVQDGAELSYLSQIAQWQTQSGEITTAMWPGLHLGLQF